MKLIRFKQSLLKLSQSYVELGHKCQVIFESQTNVALQLPDVDEESIRNITYTGNHVKPLPPPPRGGEGFIKKLYGMHRGQGVIQLS